MSPLLRRARLQTLALLCLSLSAAWAQSTSMLTIDQRQQDFDAFCRFVADSYAYFDRKATDWSRVCLELAVEAKAAPDRDALVGVLEHALAQVYDSHAHLGTHTPHSPRLVPTQADVMATWRDGIAVVTAVRQGSAAANAGVSVGDEIDAINDMPVGRAAAEFEPTFVRVADKAAHEWALQMALGGRHDQPGIRLALRSAAVSRTVTYAPAWPRPAQPLTAALHGRVAHIRINNTLGDLALIAAFDSALTTLPGARALVIDLRDTPSGGTSEVARGIMGRLIDRERPYQRHELVEESRHAGIRRIWVEYVVPRGPVFRGPVVVLVGRWTGSMGEGLAIGLNAARGSPVWGQPMARLRHRARATPSWRRPSTSRARCCATKIRRGADADSADRGGARAAGSPCAHRRRSWHATMAYARCLVKREQQ